MVADPTKPAERQVRYRNALHGVYKMVREEGPTSIFRGLTPNTVSRSFTKVFLSPSLSLSPLPPFTFDLPLSVSSRPPSCVASIYRRFNLLLPALTSTRSERS